MITQAATELRPLVSIVIPARNEGADIARTLEVCLDIDYAPKEIIVVDDSTDETPVIVASYAERNVRLIHRAQNDNGCCGARTTGMRHAAGVIVVLLNADARPAPDFINRILTHYRDGADYVIVRSRVANRDSLWGRFAAAQEDAWFSTDPPMEWSEGFSCGRAAAESVGYIPGDFPVRFCRDWLLGETLNRNGFKKHVDLDIEVQHVVPSDLRSFWRNRVWRGTFSAPYAYYFRRLTFSVIIARELLKAGRTILRSVLVVPILWQAYHLAAYSSGQLRAIPGLMWCALVQDAATIIGNFRGVANLMRFAGAGKYSGEIDTGSADRHGQP
jgi:glycosyltransferase involved in cell wall biosynthesis